MAFLLFVVMFCACDKPGVVGCWKSEDEYAEYYIEFKADGTGTDYVFWIGGDGSSTAFTYNVDESRIVMHTENGKDIESKYEITNDTLTFVYDDGVSIKYNRCENIEHKAITES